MTVCTASEIMNRWMRIWTLALAIGLVAGLPLVARPVAAHEHVTVGEYEFIVGWRDEPAVAGAKNSLDLGIEHHDPNGTTSWVVGVASNLTATLSIGPASVAKALEPQFGRDGWYTFDVIPTREGIYSVRVMGTLGSTAVDIKVDLDQVIPASDLEFPVTDPTPSDLEALIAAANASLAIASIIAVTGLAVGGTGIIVAWGLTRKSRKTS